MNILIVDDYPGLIELYDLALRARGFHVVGAATAGEAMTRAVCTEEPFDAVVLDVQLPDGNGPDLVRRMRQIPALESTAFIGISSFDTDDVQSCFDAFVTKPCHPKLLAQVLRRVVRPRMMERKKATAL